MPGLLEQPLMNNKGATVKKLAPTFAAEIVGVDLTQGLSDQAFQEIHDAVTKYGVVIIRQTGLNDESHIALGRRFGELDDIKPYIAAGRASRLKHHELFDVSNVEVDGVTIVDPSSPRGQANKGNDLFHVDSSFNPRRAGYSLLLAHELPPAGMGGHTAFADTRTAFDDLDDDLKRRLLENDFVAAHSMHHSRKLAAPDFFADMDPTQHPMGRHRLLQRHEISDRMNLYIAAHVHHIEGLAPEESQELFDQLYAHATQDKYTVEIEWENPGDLVIWDNTCTMHRAVGGPFLRQYRRDMRRVTVHDSSSQAWGLNERTNVRVGMP